MEARLCTLIIKCTEYSLLINDNSGPLVVVVVRLGYTWGTSS